jgi:hypothetical protein
MGNLFQALETVHCQYRCSMVRGVRLSFSAVGTVGMGGQHSAVRNMDGTTDLVSDRESPSTMLEALVAIYPAGLLDMPITPRCTF